MAPGQADVRGVLSKRCGRSSPGMISRYDDTHEPRAFGDTIQATGASTMLVEAGGWPDADIEPLTRVHFHGMLTTLHAIATDKCGDADVKIYEIAARIEFGPAARLHDFQSADSDADHVKSVYCRFGD